MLRIDTKTLRANSPSPQLQRKGAYVTMSRTHPYHFKV